MTHRSSIQGALGLLLLVQTMATQAQPATASDTSVHSTSGRAKGEAAGPVLLEMFEFIGEFTTEDGEWVDPTLLLEVGDSDVAEGTRSDAELGVTRGAEEQSVPDENCISPRCE
jgi:hypothetical protein